MEKKYTQDDVDSFLLTVMREGLRMGAESERARIVALLEEGDDTAALHSHTPYCDCFGGHVDALDIDKIIAAIRAPDTRDPIDELRAMAAAKLSA